MTENIRPKLTFDIEDKPNMRMMIRKDPQRFREFMRMWMYVADKMIGDNMSLSLIKDTAEQVNIPEDELVAGIIAGCLNEQFINEKIAPVLGKELLPVALLTLKGQTWEGEEAYFDWRRWYHMSRYDSITSHTIAKVIGNIMKYARFLDFDKLSEALESNQLIAFKGLADQQVKLLPFYPALQYQKDHMGSEFKVGKFMPEHNAGFFDCGTIDPTESHCLACGRRDLTRSKDNKHIYCRACNAGYYPKEGDAE
jgi:hypothetical protein